MRAPAKPQAAPFVQYGSSSEGDLMSRLLLIGCLFALGCGHRTTVSSAASSDPKDTMPATERVRRAVPVLNRTLTQNDLNQLRTFMDAAKGEKGYNPKSLADMPDLPRAAPHIAKAIESGEFVLAGGMGDVLG